MMHIDDDAAVDCPHCGAETTIDLASIAIGQEQPIVDCTVCCRPLRVDAQIDEHGEVHVAVDAIE